LVLNIARCHLAGLACSFLCNFAFRCVPGLALVALLATTCVTAQVASPPGSLERVRVIIDGERVELEMRIYKPAPTGRFPTLVFNHGSTGFGMDPTRFTQPIDAPALAAFFVDRGWAVVMPARRGRAGSEGTYDEGFSAIRALGYSCVTSRSLAGADRALQDIEAAMAAIVAMPFVDRDRVVMAGVSRGGALSVAYAGAHPAQLKGVINFVGGWLGWPCPTTESVNQALLKRGAIYPGKSIWLYAENDSYYSLHQSRGNHAAFIAAGGNALFLELAVPAADGHWLTGFPAVWSPHLEAYLTDLGLPSQQQRLSPSLE
jgi:dienelactone hydrolase